MHKFFEKKHIVYIALLACTLILTACTQKEQPQSSDGSQNPDYRQDIEPNEHFTDDIKSRGKLIVGCKSDVPGLSYYDTDSQTWSGLETDIAYKTAAGLFETSPEEAAEKGLVEFVKVTVADREEILEKGAIDCMLATFTITDERKERFAFSESYYTDYIGIMVKDYGDDLNSLGSKQIRSIADLDGKYIGVPRNATTRNDFLTYIQTMNSITASPIFCEFESYKELKQALDNGNIDAMAVDVSILNGYSDNSTKILTDRFAGQHYGAAVLPENAGLLPYINAAIESKQ